MVRPLASQPRLSAADTVPGPVSSTGRRLAGRGFLPSDSHILTGEFSGRQFLLLHHDIDTWGCKMLESAAGGWAEGRNRLTHGCEEKVGD